MQSIAKHGIVAPDIKIIVVVNDDLSLIAELAGITNPLKLNIDILHYSKITDWNGHIGWDSQQYFKLAIANFITTPWYLIIDSDNCVWDHVSLDEILTDNQAKYVYTPAAEYHIENLHNALAIWNIPIDNHSMGDSTPFVMHTHTVKELLSHTDKTWLEYNVQGQLVTFEFFLYYSYLIYTSTLDLLYVKKNNYPLIRGIQR